MLTAEQAQALHERMLEQYGEDITLRRLNSSPTPPTDVAVKARVTGYQPEEMVGGIQSGDRRLIVLAEDVTFSPALKVGDKALVRGRLLNIETVDDSTRRIAGTLIAYELRARG